jgi:F-type H+-transporting ATPase subunit a
MEHHASAFSTLLTQLLGLSRQLWTGYGSHPMSVLERYDHLLITLLAALVVIGLTMAVKKRLSIIPSPLQSLFESYYELVEGLAKGAIPRDHQRYIPFIGTLGLLILVNNALGMVPFFGTGNSNLNVTVACAILVFLVYNFEGTRVNGIHYWTHLGGPANNLFMIILGVLLIFPLEFLGLFIRIFSHSMRLFLNMALEHIISAAFFSVIPLVLPVPVMFLGFITVLVQALVFITLTAVYIGGAVMEMHHEDHGHDEGHGHAAHAH